jgi:creatinine amidohydrolase
MSAASAAAPGVRFGHLTREQAHARRDCVLLLPVGATEQHGPHLPVATDTLIVEHVALAAAEQAATRVPVLVMPTFAYGHSAHHLPWTGTASITSGSLIAVLTDILGSVARAGFGRLFLLNGHGGNGDVLGTVAREVALAHDVAVAVEAWWRPAGERVAAERARLRGRYPGHAGAVESSLVLALQPTLVGTLPQRPDAPLVPDGYRVERGDLWRRLDGYTDDPADADARAGRRILDTAASALSEVIVDFYEKHAANGALR